MNWLEPVTGSAEGGEPVIPAAVLVVTTLVLVLIGAGIAWLKYGRADVPLTAPAASLATIAARNDLFQDSVNRAVFERPGTHLTRTLVYADAAIVDGAVNGTGGGVAKTGEALKVSQSGKVRAYALIMVTGVLLAGFFAVLGGK